MNYSLLNRREFLRLSLILTGSALATACLPTRSGFTPTAPPRPSPESGIHLKGGNADAWTFIKSLQGSMANPAACQSVLFDNNGARTQAALQEYFFSADVPIRPGANPLIAVCKQANQEEELSPEITITGRLGQRPTAIITPSLVQGIIILDGGGSLPDEVESQPIREYVWSARSDNPVVA